MDNLIEARLNKLFPWWKGYTISWDSFGDEYSISIHNYWTRNISNYSCNRGYEGTLQMIVRDKEDSNGSKDENNGYSEAR